jgi:hypothetical protein
MRRGLLLSFAILICQPFAAQAGEFYYSIMGGSATYDEPSLQFKVGSGGGKLGYRLNDYLGVEVHGIAGGSDTASGVTFDLNSIAGAFLRFSLPLASDGRIQLYLLGGYSSAEMKAETATTKTSLSENSASYGVGVDLYANQEHGLFVEWVRYLDDTALGVDYTVDNVSLGYIQYF